VCLRLILGGRILPEKTTLGQRRSAGKNGQNASGDRDDATAVAASGAIAGREA
jgi:hypothetical protein